MLREKRAVASRVRFSSLLGEWHKPYDSEYLAVVLMSDAMNVRNAMAASHS